MIIKTGRLERPLLRNLAQLQVTTLEKFWLDFSKNYYEQIYKFSSYSKKVTFSKKFLDWLVSVQSSNKLKAKNVNYCTSKFCFFQNGFMLPRDCLPTSKPEQVRK
ncbi:unnamed protein product [Moneuplotes crassus]|uniref:Uncharacterized protein n=1 Tax=Euplotes crassus TaxID=5936 RepID=A0AAD1UKS3_EUPCR|nr:unnamed protein product [Moneuplotes crassus]